MPRTLALLSLNNTLFHADDPNRINEMLLDVLFRNQVKDIYFFTDLLPNTYNTRQWISLTSKLKKRGFEIHGVLTLCDLFWDTFSATEAENLKLHHPELFQDKPFDGHAFKESICEQSNYCLPEINTSIMSFKNGGIPGRAYEQAKSEIERNGVVSQTVDTMCQVTKAVAEYYAEGVKNVHPKSLLLGSLMYYQPGWGDIVITESNPDVISRLKDFSPPVRNKPASKLIIIPAQNGKMTTNDYNKSIAEISNIESVIGKINEHIATLRAGSNPFLRNPNEKIRALQTLILELRIEINKCSGMSIDQIISAWERSMESSHIAQGRNINLATIIAKHRNWLLPESRPSVLTNTEIFINSLKEDFRDIHLKNQLKPNNTHLPF